MPGNSIRTSIGSGVFKYEGNSWEENCIFCGWCSSLNSGTWKFTGPNAQTFFEDFRKIFWIAENKESFLFWSFQANGYCSISLSQTLSSSEVGTLFERTINNQQKKQPKVSKQKEDLAVGSKNSGNSILFSPVVSTNESISTFKCSSKFMKESKFFDFLLTNEKSSIINILVYFLLQTIAKLTLTEILVDARTALIENHKIHLVTETQTEETLSKDGLTVKRSLAAVKNKLINASTSIESKKVFLNWLQTILSSFKDDEMFKESFQNFSPILKEAEPTSSSSSRGRSRKESESSKIFWHF